jgi:hypothetical protein
MAIAINSAAPVALLRAIERSIDENHIETWSYDEDGDFTHSVAQWNRRAWLRPVVQEGCLILNILPPRGQKLSKEVYAVYHGRFIEMVLAHFDSACANVTATAMPTVADVVAA